MVPTYLHQLILEMARPGHLPIELGKLYNRLMDMRGDDDYSDTVTFGKSTITIIKSTKITPLSLPYN